jgi:hypothetical protein
MKPVKNIRLAVITILGVACSLSAFAGTYSTAANKTLATKIAKSAPNMNPEALKLGLRAYDHARLQGLDKGFNSNAYRRVVVMHPAAYAGRAFIKRYGYLGRSWGCFALSTRVEPSVVKTIKNGTIIFAYYPDKKLERDSAYLQPLTSKT